MAKDDAKKVEKKPIKKADAKKVEVSEVDDTDLLNDIVGSINSKFKDSAILLDAATMAQVNVLVPTGVAPIDKVLGGGAPAGRILEVYGVEAGGKTSLALLLAKSTQSMGGIVVFLDTEYALDKRRAKSMGINLKKLIYATPSCIEDTFDYIESITLKIQEKAPNRLVTIIWDSIAGTPSKAEMDGEYEDQQMGASARALSKGFRKITGLIATHNILLVCINQIREKMNVSFGEKTSTPGGRALKFHASQRIEVTRIGSVKDKEKVVGSKVKVTIKKNKIFAPFGVADVEILFQETDGGFDPYGALLDAGFIEGIFGTSAGWYEINGKKYRKGEAREYLKENPEEYDLYVSTYLSM